MADKRRKNRFSECLLILLAFASGIATSLKAGAPEVVLASGGQAYHDVVIAANACEEVEQAAFELAEKLTRITGAEFSVSAGNGNEGIVLGVYTDFNEVAATPDFAPDDPKRREEYLMRTHEGGVRLIGAAPEAVTHAVWDFLYRLGYRQFFPGEAWEVIPRTDAPAIRLDEFESPDYWARRLSSLTSRAPDRFNDGDDYAAWQRRNRLADGFLVRSTHFYGAIIRANQEAFDRNPDFYAKVDGERKWRGASTKLCISNPELRELVVAHAVRVMEENPDQRSISMDPSDGGRWCECGGCEEMGSISDRVVTLANEVAEAINNLGQGKKYVGFYAYNFHTAPPNIEMHPNIAVSVAAGHLTGGWKPKELFEAWGKRGGAGFFGVFEYYNNIISSFLPHGQRISNLNYLKDTIPGFHRRGARMMVSGTAHGNGPVALGAYVASRILWDLNDADRVGEIYRDFLEKAFAGVEDIMDEFFRLIYRIEENDRRMSVTEDLVGRMYRKLDQALQEAGEKAVRRRIKHMILYTRYVELFKDFNAAQGEEARLKAYGEVLRHAFRMRETMMVNVYGLFAFPRQVAFPEDARWSVPAGENPWKDTRPIEDEDIFTFLEKGMANNEVGDYEILAFSDNLVPAAEPLGFPEREPGRHGFGLPPQGVQEFFTWVDEAPADVKLMISGGGMWPDRAGKIKITLFSEKAIDDDMDFIVVEKSFPPDIEDQLVRLPTPHKGLHRIEVDGDVGAAKVLPADENMMFTRYMGPTRHMNTRHWKSVYFYVPKGTKQISFYTPNPVGDIRNADGETVFRFWRDFRWAKEREDITTDTRSGGYFICEVPEGQDGRVWMIDGVSGAWQLLNVPPYVALRPSQLMLPEEIVETDSY